MIFHHCFCHLHCPPPPHLNFHHFLMIIVGMKFRCMVCGLSQGYHGSTSSMCDNKSSCLAAGKLVQKLTEKLGDNKSEHAEKLVDKEVLIPRQSTCWLDWPRPAIGLAIYNHH